MVLESLVSINEHYGNLLAIKSFQFRIRINVDYGKRERDALPDTLDDLFRFIAQVAARAAIYFDSNRIVRH